MTVLKTSRKEVQFHTWALDLDSNPALPVVSCVNLGKFLNLSVL